jgi:hypothetical protein
MIIVWPTLYESMSCYGISIPVYNYSPPEDVPSNHATYKVCIDWDGNGTFGGTGEDVTADVKWIRFNRGRDSERGTASVGTCEIRLNNSAGTYTPTLHATILPKRLMQITTTTGGASTLFTGYIEDITPHPDLSTQDCYITAVDGMDYLARCNIESVLYGLLSPKTLIGNILTLANWPTAARRLDNGLYNIPVSSFNSTSARSAIEDIALSQGGWVYIDRDGYLVFEDLNHQTNYHSTPEFIFNNSMNQIAYTLNTKDVYNELIKDAESTVTEPEEHIWYYVVWVPVMDLNAKISITATWEGPAVITSVEVGTLGRFELFSRTDRAESMDLVFNTLTWGSSYLTCTIRGYHYSYAPIQIKVSDATSQTAYQKRSYIVGGCAISSVDTLTLLTAMLAKYKDPHISISMTLINKTNALLNQILRLDIGSRVTLINTKLGINADYYITYMEHEISQGGLLHSATYKLSPV